MESTPMTDPLEAAAIKVFEAFNEIFPTVKGWEDISGADKERCRALAQAAIRALADNISGEMVEAANRVPRAHETVDEHTKLAIQAALKAAMENGVTRQKA